MTRFGIHRLVAHYARSASKSTPSLSVKRVSPHIIRHTTAVHLLRSGVDINTIRAWLGHVSLDTTHVYAEVDMEMKATALASVDIKGLPQTPPGRTEMPSLMAFLRDLYAHFPEGTCGCGRNLAGARDLGVRYSHQVTDLPEARAETVQHDRHEVQCACGQVHVAGPPPEAGGAPGTVTYGLNLQAWCVFLMVMHHVPVERCADILGSMSGTRPSDGWVHALLARAATAVAAANKTIRALIILARVVCGDETPIRSGPGPKTKKRYLQVACTSLLTYYFLGSRDLPSFKDFIYSDLHGTVIVHDRYVNYDHFTGVSHQLCTAHLLRDIEDAVQSYPDAIWPGQIAEALRGLIHAANLSRDQGLAAVPGETTAEHLTLFRRGITVGLSQVRRVPGAKTKQPPARLLLECLRYREADVLRFLTDTAIPPTSNQAERDLRPSKTQQKISGRLRSDKTTRDRYAIRGYASTAAKHGITVFTAIRDALTGNPWIPPIPAIA